MKFGDAFNAMLEGKTIARSIWPQMDEDDKRLYPETKNWISGLSLFAYNKAPNPDAGIWYTVSDEPKDNWNAFLFISGYSTSFCKDMLKDDWIIIE